MRISVRDGWRERAHSPGSYAVEDRILHLVDGRPDECPEGSGDGEGIVVLDAEYVKNAPLREVVDVVVHESIHDAIFKGIRDGGRGDELTAYWRYDGIKDFVEFWRDNDVPGSSKLGDEPTPSEVPRKVKGVLIKLLVLMIFILMLTAAMS